MAAGQHLSQPSRHPDRIAQAIECLGFVVDWSKHLNATPVSPSSELRCCSKTAPCAAKSSSRKPGSQGGAVYALSPQLRDAIEAKREATLNIALRPDVAADEINRRLTLPRGKQSLSTFLRKALNLAPVEIALLQEATGGKLATLAPVEIARLVNAIPTRLIGIAPLTRAISTAGGVPLDTLDGRFMLRGKPGVFVAGEMLDWEAPTGGYLLQACFATGAAAARGALLWMDGNEERCRLER